MDSTVYRAIILTRAVCIEYQPSKIENKLRKVVESSLPVCRIRYWRQGIASVQHGMLVRDYGSVAVAGHSPAGQRPAGGGNGPQH